MDASRGKRANGDRSPGPAGASPLCSDGRRALVALAPSIGLPVLAGLALRVISFPGAGSPAAYVILCLLGWNLFAVIYVVITLRTFRRVDAEEFHRRMTARGRRSAWGIWRLSSRADGPTFAVEGTVVAFTVVLVLPHVHSIRINDLLLVPVTLSVLLSSWALSIVSYALHYAQYDLEQPGLQFPGERTNAFEDYMYFALGVATTFGATDASIVTPRMRRVVNLHTLLTFIYNSVIVALLASLLLSS
jgi:uncharacterized membrane protein